MAMKKRQRLLAFARVDDLAVGDRERVVDTDHTVLGDLHGVLRAGRGRRTCETVRAELAAGFYPGGAQRRIDGRESG
jgi:hypothetical protein